MTREEALKRVKGYLTDYFSADCYGEVEEIMEALEQQPCDDCISRQAAKKALEDRFMKLQKRHDDKRYETNYCLNTILELPPVTPKKKTGHWIDITNKNGTVIAVRCDCCENSPKHAIRSDFCPNCGVKMVESQESEG